MDKGLPNEVEMLPDELREPAAPEELAARLRATVGALVRATRAADQLPTIPATVLDLLDLAGPMTTADLAARRGVRHQTMTATVKELLDAGYLVVTPDPGDGRKKILELTARGRDVLDADRRQRVSILAEAFRANLSEDERRVVAHALTLIERVTPTLAAQGQSSALDRGLITGAW